MREWHPGFKYNVSDFFYVSLEIKDLLIFIKNHTHCHNYIVFFKKVWSLNFEEIGIYS